MRADMDRPDNFINRELSWMEFNRRVLDETENPRNPLLERLRFLGITASNLDEFFMVRVAALRDQMEVGYPGRDLSGMTPSFQLEQLDIRIRDFRASQYEILEDCLIPALQKEGIELVGGELLQTTPEDDGDDGETAEKEESILSDADRKYLRKYFRDNVFPVLTPMAIDSSRPFPLIQSGQMHIGALVKVRGKKKKKYDVATVPVPSVLPRVIPLPRRKDQPGLRVVLLETLLEANLEKLFLNHEILCSSPYRVMRNADLAIAEEEAPDLLLEIEKQLRKRERGEVIMMEHVSRMDRRLVKYLKKRLKVKNRQIYAVPGPLDLTFLFEVASAKGFRHLKRRPWIPQVTPELVAGPDLFSQIRKRDVLVHHPYESFDPVEDLIRQAAGDEKVLAIKLTLYRVSGNSPIITHLETAARNGKQVMVLVELKARFDEERNINWARRLEHAGVHVIYGLVGLKIHCKIALIVRMESDGIRRYVHLGSGNYNDKTARQYTDVGLFTCGEEMGEDATALFNMLSGYSRPAHWNRMIVAPYHMKDRLIELIRNEAVHAREGRPAGIIAKCNALCDRDVITALYEASCAGVPIRLIVRGICCLIPGKAGVSENIRVCSLVGTYLEHARIYTFENAGNRLVYMGSADLMPRNLERRVEILVPVGKKSLQERVMHILKTELSDTENTWNLQPGGSYVKPEPGEGVRADAQRIFMEEAAAAAHPDADWRSLLSMKGEIGGI